MPHNSSATVSMARSPSVLGSGAMRTRSTPRESMARIMRTTALIFSLWVEFVPWATSRRRSLPAAGLTIMPALFNGSGEH